MGDTKIEWADKVWNPVTGCTKVSEGCRHCYAERDFARPYPGRKFTDVVCHEDRLEAPLHWRKPARIFVNSMGDLFHEAVPDEFIARILSVAGLGKGKHHVYQILTKRPARMKAIIEDICAVGNCMPPSNLWLGVSVENQATADERIPLLLQTPVALRWISYEPALGPLDLRAIEQADDEDGSGALFFPLDGEFTCEGRNEPAPIKSGGIRWVVCGGESGPQARPMHPDWARAVRDQCQAAGVPFFFKQWGEWEPSLKFLEQFKDVSPKTPVLRLSSDAHIGHNLAEMEGHPRQGLMVKTGKKRAGRLLDGREWNEYPEVHA